MTRMAAERRWTVGVLVLAGIVFEGLLGVACGKLVQEGERFFNFLK